MRPNNHTDDDPGPTIRWPLAGWIVGLVTTAYPTLLSGFARVQGGLGDSRLLNFVLEHSYRWLMGLPLADDLWSPPIFHPVRGVAAYTDLLLGLAPIYWPWRWLGAEPHTAYQLWMLSCWSLNFFAFYLLLRRGLGISAPGASAGAYLFAFGSARMANVVHQQVVAQFFLVLVLIAVIELVRLTEKPRDSVRSWLWVGLLYAALLAQLATAVYPLVFLELCMGIALVVVLMSPQGRVTLWAAVKRHWLPLAVGGAIAVAAATPVVLRYWSAAGELGVRPYMPEKLPRLLSWMLMGPFNLVYGWLHDLPALAWADKPDHNYGVGAVTLLLCGVGLWRGRHRPVVRLLVAVVAVLFVVTLRLPGGDSLWGTVRDWVPGATALRAMARVAMVGLYAAAVGLAFTFDWLARRRRWRLLAVLAAVVVLEQVQLPRTWDKTAARLRVAEIAAAVPDGSECFIVMTTSGPVDPYVQEDAEWAALERGIPTINGRLGLSPRRWRLARVHVGQPKLRRKVEARLDAWILLHALDRDRVARVEISPRPKLTRRPSRSPSEPAADP